MTGTALSRAISSRSAGGQLAFGLYLVPGFPDWPTSHRALEHATRLGVDFIEFPIITAATWSERTGPLIARALQISLAHRDRDRELTGWLSAAPLRVGVVYESAWPAPADWRAPVDWLSASAALLLEMSVADLPGYAAGAHGVPLVATVDGTAPRLTRADRDSLRRGGGFVYAALGPRTGAAGQATLPARTADVIHTLRPDLPICCAFGIRDPDQVTAIRTTGTCAGLIVGTAALAQLAAGLDDFASWLTRMVRATRSTGGTGARFLRPAGTPTTAQTAPLAAGGP